jgi:invasion protein IalB
MRVGASEFRPDRSANSCRGEEMPTQLTREALSMPPAAPKSARATILALGAAFALIAGGAAAQTKSDDKPKDAPAAKPESDISYGDWSVFHSQSGKTKICYALSQPKDRQPDDLKRDPGYAYVTERPGEGVRNEVSFIMGFDIGAPNPDSDDPKDKKKKLIAPTAELGDDTFDLLSKGGNLWVKNAAQESDLIAGMRKGGKLVVKATSKKGNLTTDTYSLSGFGQAIDRAVKDCAAGG